MSWLIWRLGWAGLGSGAGFSFGNWAALAYWAGLGWAGLGWAGLGLAWLGWAGLAGLRLEPDLNLGEFCDWNLDLGWVGLEIDGLGGSTPAMTSNFYVFLYCATKPT